jgi:hypothetical protein
MKRSKFFLAATSGLLAIVGVAAAKAHHSFNNSTTGFYKKDANCNSTSSIAGFIQTMGNATSSIVHTSPTGGGGSYTVYSLSHPGACASNKLRTKANQN